VVPAGGEKVDPLSLSLGEAAADPRTAKREDRPTITLDLAKVPGIVPGAKLHYFAQADDFGGHVGQSAGYDLLILTKEDMKRILNDRLMLLRDQLREIARDEESARKDLQGLQDELSRGGKSLDAAAATRLVRNRQDQERITSRLTRMGKEFEALLQKMESNRVGEAKEKEWIAGLGAEVGNFAGARSPEISKAIEAVRQSALEAPQPPDRLLPITDAERKLERDILLLASRLSEFGDVNWVIQQLQDLKRRQEEIRDRTRLRARETTPAGGGDAGAGEGEGEGDGAR